MNEKISRPADINTELKALAGSKKSIGSLLLGELVGLLVALVMLFTVGLYSAYCIGFVILLYDLLLIRPARKRRKLRLTAMNAVLGTGEPLENCTYQHRAELPADIFSRTKLSAAEEWPIGAICRHKVEGTRLRAGVSLCECSVGMKWGRRRGDVEFLSGTLFTASGLKTGTAEAVCICRDMPYGAIGVENFEKLGFARCDFSSAKLNDYAILLTRGGNAPMWLESSLLKLSDSGRTQMLLSLTEGALTVFLRARFFAGKYSAGADATAEMLTASRLPELNMLLEMLSKNQQETNILKK